MSKVQLKKTLATLTPEQKDELILDLYSARAEAKAYLEFFINPDIDKLIEKSTSEIAKEVFKRGSRGYNKPRISRIRNVIKNVATLNPGAEYVLALMFNTLSLLATAGNQGYWYTEISLRSFGRIIAEMLRLADDNAMLEPTLARLNNLIDGIKSGPFHRPGNFMRQQLKYHVEEGIAMLGSSKK